MTDTDWAVSSAVFLTFLITSLVWGLLWALVTVDRIKGNNKDA
jgi:heme/copper-type cytochrome/quinol oxidase subunit 4